MSKPSRINPYLVRSLATPPRYLNRPLDQLVILLAQLKTYSASTKRRP
ncbi:hypothetical protein [Nostoc sp. ChiQUE01b]|nr:hypothetical protein [Nostoc sp. ChiQUE01b]MDZ8263651.1 hypothetical protein [Nostoc sp. ChiQUE01b]